MLYIIHRVNTIKELAKIPSEYGVEIDVRGFGGKLFLSHNPIAGKKKYDELDAYLKNLHHSFVIFNIKEAGYEQQVMDLAKKYEISSYFLLDVEFPYLYRATRQEGIRKIAVRYSEAEPIEGVLAQTKNRKPLLDWVWIDTNTRLPLDTSVVGKLKAFKTCLVCPSRWGREQDIVGYAQKMHKLGFKVNAVMTSIQYVDIWKKYV